MFLISYVQVIRRVDPSSIENTKTYAFTSIVLYIKLRADVAMSRNIPEMRRCGVVEGVVEGVAVMLRNIFF